MNGCERWWGHTWQLKELPCARPLGVVLTIFTIRRESPLETGHDRSTQQTMCSTSDIPTSRITCRIEDIVQYTDLFNPLITITSTSNSKAEVTKFRQKSLKIYELPINEKCCPYKLKKKETNLNQWSLTIHWTVRKPISSTSLGSRFSNMYQNP